MKQVHSHKGSKFLNIQKTNPSLITILVGRKVDYARLVHGGIVVFMDSSGRAKLISARKFGHTFGFQQVKYMSDTLHAKIELKGRPDKSINCTKT